MIGFQPTLPIPPPSTIYGLISAAAGRVVTPYDTFIAYSFRSEGRTVDLERILEMPLDGGGKWNVINREILLNAELDLYVDPSLQGAFLRPHFPLLLGRSSDLATVDVVETVDLEEVSVDEVSTFGESVYTDPPRGFRLSLLYALPVYFTDTIPRRAVGTRPFTMIAERYQGRGRGHCDPAVGLTLEVLSVESLGLGVRHGSSGQGK